MESILPACRALGVNEMLLANQLHVLKNEYLCQRNLHPTEIYSIVSARIEDYDYANFDYKIQKTVCIYDVKVDVWKSAAHIEYSLVEQGEYIWVSDELIIMGGGNFPHATTSCTSVNIHTGKKIVLKSMPSPKLQMSLVLFRNEIYAIGGALFAIEPALNTTSK